jgi:hypothetical protein
MELNPVCDVKVFTYVKRGIRMKTRYLVPALMVSAFAFIVAPASAAPVANTAAPAASPLILAQMYGPDGHHRSRPPRHRPPHYIAGHRYHAPPPGWHRYHARPRDWRHRGCILVGPVWFCP